jgi:hypothetical protein
VIARLLLCLWIHFVAVKAEPFSFATLNCYWFRSAEKSAAADKPRTLEEHSAKARHLIGLLPQDAPLFVGLQEIGNDQDVQAFGRASVITNEYDFKIYFQTAHGFCKRI